MANPNTGLEGPYDLTNDEIDKVVTEKSPGTYVLDRERNSGKFIVNYVGRSDDHINDRLKNWVDTKYKRFKFSYFGSLKAAFEKECRIWHDFGGPTGIIDNKKHPERSPGKNWQCPVCDIFEDKRRWY